MNTTYTMRPHHTEQNMNGRILIALAWLFLIVTLAFPAAVAAQDPPQEQTPPEGVNQGNYNVKQTIEFGGRLTDVKGNRSIHRTFANYDEGINLFEYSLDMRSLNHMGVFWDNLSINSFGYGSDPNYVTRLRAYKNRWYNLGFTYRRDKNFWDYNLLANPLNPSTAVTNAPAGFSPVITTSPHLSQLVRRMYDYNLTLAPQSPIRVRLGYSRNINEGPSFTTFHEGTDVLLAQPWKTTLNSYQLGVDFKVFPRTNFSFDQFWHFYKGDTSWLDPFQTFSLPTGLLADGTPFTTADLGLPFNTAANQPCATPFNAGGVVNPTCNVYQQYDRQARVRSSYPSSRIAFQTSYFTNLDFAASYTYTSTDADTSIFNEFFNGLVSRTRQRQFSITGPAEVGRVSVSADFGITWHVTDKLSIQDAFNFQNFRIPGLWAMSECSFFGTTVAAAAPVFAFTVPLQTTCPTLTGGVAGTPNHATSSPADVVRAQFNNFLGEDSKTNTFMVRYDFNRHFGARLGYRYRNRDILHSLSSVEDERFFPSLPNRGACAGQPLLADGSCQVTVVDADRETTVINEHSALLGIWVRPANSFRASFDMELLSADESLTRISPRQMQRYKLRLSYQPTEWASLFGTVNINEARNNILEIFHKRHNRSYAFGAVLAPNDRFAFDIGYDFNRRFGARIGYRHRNRDITESRFEQEDLRFFPSLPNRGACAGQPLLADGSCAVTTVAISSEALVINEHSALLGLWVRPANSFRASFDMELLSADESLTRISPRQMQRYKLRLSYQPTEWASLSGTVNLNEARNNILEIFHKRHNRSYAFGAVLAPNDRFAFDIGYDFNDVFSQTNICYTIGTVPPGSTPCPTSASLLSGISLYDDDAHYFHFDWMWRPVRRLETRIGYGVIDSNGSTTLLSPNPPLGPLQVTYHLPTASVAFDLTKKLTWKAGWNYYNYDEGGPADPTGPRNFRSNLVTLSLRFAF
jgi:hypothetical protein